MSRFGISLIALALATGGLASAAGAADLTGAAIGDARTKVETAMALANIAKTDKDGDALLVAAKLLSEAGSVAQPGGQTTDGKPTMINTGEMAKTAKEMGADAAKADAVANAPTSARSDGYWYYSCDSYNNCQWIYAGW